VRFVTDAADSPHLSFPNIRGEVYLGFAETDDIIAPTVPAQLLALLKQHGIATEIAFHPHVKHGYPFPERPVYDRAAAEKDWKSIFAMLERQCPGRPAQARGSAPDQRR
jgi:carboxymethylenebutenolidase